jgi:hypothetical protein
MVAEGGETVDKEGGVTVGGTTSPASGASSVRYGGGGRHRRSGTRRAGLVDASEAVAAVDGEGRG